MDLPDTLQRFGKASLLTVKNAKTGLGSTLPMTFLIMVVLYIITYLVLNYTMVGRGVYAIGGDEISAERAGFPVKKIRFGIFVINGMLASIAGLSYAVMSMRYLPTEYSGAEECYRRNSYWRYQIKWWCRYSEGMYPWYTASYNGF